MKIKNNKYVERKGKKERIDMQSELQVDKEDLHMLKISCKGKRTVGKANKEINVEKIIIVKKIKLRKEKEKKKRKMPQKGKSPMYRQRFKKKN